MPNNAAATSDRPAPTRPAKPTTSPARRENDTFSNLPATEMFSTRSTSSCDAAERSGDIQRRTDFGEHFVRALDDRASVDEPSSRRQRAETQILCDAQVATERKLLVNHAHASGERIARAVESLLASMHEHLTA